MATITREQFNKWNGQAKGGFNFDLEHYLVWGEKELVKDVKQDDNTIIRYRLDYVEEYKEYTNEYGCTRNKRTGFLIPSLNIDKLVPTGSGVYRVISILWGRKMAEVEKTKKYSTLCKISGTIDTAEILKEFI